MSDYGFAFVSNVDPEGFWPSWSKDLPPTSQGVPHVFIPAKEGEKAEAYVLHPKGEPRRGYFYDVDEYSDAIDRLNEWNQDTTMKANGKRFCDENYVLTAVRIGDPA